MKRYSICFRFFRNPQRIKFVSSLLNYLTPLRLAWGAWLLIFLSLLLVIGPIMHESDQAALLNGAYQLAQGDANTLQAPFYNYDKQYLTYVYVALWLKGLPELDPVLVGNLSTFLAFWGAAGVLIRRHPPRTFGSAIAFCGLLLAPALWQHSAFLASNFLAAALLLMGFCAWSPASRVRQFFSIICFTAAVAARGDVLVLLPAMAWLLLPRRRWLRNPWLWILAFAGVAAFLLGRFISANPPVDAYPFYFIPKVFVAYVVFGLGAGAVLLVWWTGAWTRVALARRSILHKGYYLLGAAAFLPIGVYYSLQLFSTRHWVTLLAALAVAALSRKFRPLLNSRILAGMVLPIAFIPIFIGLNLPSPRTPSLVIGPGTPFPTADGTLSMGGYLPQLFAMRRSGFSQDHNHPLWLAAKSTDYQMNTEGFVPYVHTPVGTYVELACVLQGKRPLAVQPDAAEYYVDSRTLDRFAPSGGPGLPSYELAHLLQTRRLVPASKSEHGYRILRTEPGAPTKEMLTLAALGKAFQGDEFRRLPSPRAALDSQWRGHLIVLYTATSFRRFTFEEFAQLPPRELESANAAVSVLPSYMSVQRF